MLKQYLSVGEHLRSDGNCACAFAAYRYALNADPLSVTAQVGLAETALMLNAPAIAEDHARVVLAREPDHLAARIALAVAMVRMGRVHEAVRQIDAFADLPEGTATARMLRLMIDLRDGAYEETLFELASLAEDPRNAMIVREVFLEGFRQFQFSDPERSYAFIEALGLMPASPAAALSEREGPIDIVIPVHNALPDLIACLQSLRAAPSAEQQRIWIVDDCSGRETRDWIDAYACEHDDVSVLRNETNLGFTGSVAAGMEASTAPFVVLLNSDTLVTVGWLDSLRAAMRVSPAVALAGPLSDNAYFQTIAAPTTMGDRRLPGLVTASTQALRPIVPFLSGFCLMVRRSSYLAAGGLDTKMFVDGYWEVQDLCLRLLDMGYHFRIADDAFVYHTGGRSVTSERKSALIERGWARLIGRHSALRVMAAETISALQPDVLDLKLKIAAALAPRGIAGLATAPALRWRVEPPDDLEGKEVCLFVANAPFGYVSELTQAYLAALRGAGILTILCPIVASLDAPLDPRLGEVADAVVVRENGGFDFGAWADVLRALPALWSAERLLFANDSVIGPLVPMERLLDNIRAENAGFFALSECTDFRHHAQSFFFGWSRANLAAPALREFWDRIDNLTDKSRVVFDYEFALLELGTRLPDPRCQVLFGFRELFGVAPQAMTGVNPTHHAWRRMVEVGFPFIKTDLLRDGRAGISTEGWRQVCADCGVDTMAVERHIELSRISRAMPPSISDLITVT